MIDVLNARLKIVITGATGAGKTAFIRAINEILPGCQVTAMPDGSGDMAYFYGGIPIPETQETLYLVEPPSTEPHGRNLLPVADASGMVFLVDSTLSYSFHAARAALKMIDTYAPFPVVVAANKQDYNVPYDTFYGGYAMGQHIPWTPDGIARALELPDAMTVMPCVATDAESVKRVLITLLYEIIAAMDTMP